MGDFGYNQLLAQSWKGHEPCDKWCGITCVEGQIVLASMNLTGSISKRFVDLTSLYALELLSNMFTGTIPCILTMVKLIRSLNLSYNQLGLGILPGPKTRPGTDPKNPGPDRIRTDHFTLLGLVGEDPTRTRNSTGPTISNPTRSGPDKTRTNPEPTPNREFQISNWVLNSKTRKS
ncbi:hypothetical protein N665_0312s0013 [Sinapis alba]|nr:hypothetical protein N665_0312s0013 [Sinapis alba]